MGPAEWFTPKKTEVIEVTTAIVTLKSLLAAEAFENGVVRVRIQNVAPQNALYIAWSSGDAPAAVANMGVIPTNQVWTCDYQVSDLEKLYLAGAGTQNVFVWQDAGRR